MNMVIAVFLGVVVAIVLVAVIAILIIRAKLRRMSKEILGTTDLKKAYMQGKKSLEDTPRSVSSMTRLMLPQIAKDFPDFNWDQMKNLIESKLTHKLKDQGADSILIHKTEIAGYNKGNGLCTITAQSAVEYWSEPKEKTDDIKKIQTKYDTSLIYVQDMEQVGNDASGIGLNCPNCGAPIRNLGAKYCEYCHTAVQEIDIRVWTVGSIKEVTKER